MAKASSLAKNLAKELECAVCLEQYKEPKVLPCLHSFCKKCLEGLLTKQGLVWKLNCPSCRASVEIPQGQVDSLPVNFFLNNLLSMVSLHSERSNVECDNCDSGDPAVNRCTICCHFLCEFCSAGHKRGRSTKTHRLMTLEEARVEGPIAVVRPSFCQEHEGEILKLFCETCDKAICRDCTIVKHRDHKYTFVKDAFAKEKDVVMGSLSKTKAKVSTLQNSLDTISEMKRSIQSSVGQTVLDVTNCFNDLTANLNTRRDELISEVEELGKTKLKVLEIQQEELETALGTVQSSVEFTEKAFKNGSEVEILNMRKQMSTRLQELNAAEWQLEPRADDVVKFEVDDQLKQDIATFGAITNVVTHTGALMITMGHGSEGVMYNTLCGQPIEFTIIAKERNGQKRSEGGDLFTASCSDGSNFEILDVRDCGDGTYSFFFTPHQEGWFELNVFGMGQAVQGSPFTWFVEKWNLMKSSSGNSEEQIQLSEGKLVAHYIKKTESHDNVRVLPADTTQKLTSPTSRPVKRSGRCGKSLGKYTSSSLSPPSPFNQSASVQFGVPLEPQVFGRSTSSSVCQGKQPLFGHSASMSGRPVQQPLFGQSASSSVDLQQQTSVGQGLFSPQQQPLFGQATFVGQSASSPGVLPLGTLMLHHFDKQLYVVSSASFNAGKHLWKAKLLGNTSEGFSFGIINTGALAKANWWVWNSKFYEVLSPSIQCQYLSKITDCASSDIIEMYLDCDTGTLKMYNQRTKESDIWYGVERDVCPVFHMTTNGDQVSLLL